MILRNLLYKETLMLFTSYLMWLYLIPLVSIILSVVTWKRASASMSALLIKLVLLSLAYAVAVNHYSTRVLHKIHLVDNWSLSVILESANPFMFDRDQQRLVLEFRDGWRIYGSEYLTKTYGFQGQPSVRVVMEDNGRILINFDNHRRVWAISRDFHVQEVPW